jgi:hypothetical protein
LYVKVMRNNLLTLRVKLTKPQWGKAILARQSSR